MEVQAFHILVASMFCNFIVLGISINRPDSFYPVSLSAISISFHSLTVCFGGGFSSSIDFCSLLFNGDIF